MVYPTSHHHSKVKRGWRGWFTFWMRRRSKTAAADKSGWEKQNCKERTVAACHRSVPATGGLGERVKIAAVPSRGGKAQERNWSEQRPGKLNISKAKQNFLLTITTTYIHYSSLVVIICIVQGLYGHNFASNVACLRPDEQPFSFSEFFSQPFEIDEEKGYRMCMLMQVKKISCYISLPWKQYMLP